MTPRKGHIVVFGNEKGGSGKSTTCMHVIVALLRLGKSVGTIDLDPRQRSLMRYIENRAAWAERMNLDLPFPRPQVIERSKRDSAAEAHAEEKERFEAVLA